VQTEGDRMMHVKVTRSNGQEQRIGAVVNGF
jgi:hypothetical protein